MARISHVIWIVTKEVLGVLYAFGALFFAWAAFHMPLGHPISPAELWAGFIHFIEIFTKGGC